jgi:hypothetical protein
MTVAADPSTLGLTFEQCVPRDLVHKAAVEQVLVTDFARLGESEFACAGQAPRAHAYFNDTLGDTYDTMMLLESGRQAFIRAVHEMLGVPRTTQFAFSELDMSVVDLSTLRIGAAPAQLVWNARLSDPRHIRGELASMRAGADLYLDGRRCLEIAGSGTFVNERMYRLLRGRKRKQQRGDPPARRSRLAPSVVGRQLPGNVVIDRVEREADGCSAELVVDPGHPTFFDHALDHVPAMLLVEAMRQVALSATGSPKAIVTSCRVEYRRYAELDAGVRCVARHDGWRSGRPVAVSIEQQGVRLGGGELVLATP